MGRNFRIFIPTGVSSGTGKEKITVVVWVNECGISYILTEDNADFITGGRLERLFRHIIL